MPPLAVLGIIMWALAIAALYGATRTHGRAANLLVDACMVLFLLGSVSVVVGNTIG